MIRRAALLALVVLFLSSLVVSAGKGWCRSDPIVVLDGVQHNVEVAVKFPEDGSGRSVSSTVFGFHVGEHAYELIQTDDGFDGTGETVRFHENGMEGDSYVLVKTNEPFDAVVFVDGVEVASGSTGTPIYYSLT
jgi:hypothetical protein